MEERTVMGQITALTSFLEVVIAKIGPRLKGKGED